ncbi:hypothetical protein INP83_03660 [Mucilaginibacter sp. 21P]|uniref:hypothetical protein n=1 Tax=Mucilaginibacter sp. 21P TaxID=2778902 RepID=UPI001C57A3AA|nr:hypothetical protein [Mucilaginibacter sp. 21P]QXV66199.1 hypothetical protein INP83_03660 [Mucilaginibacter sp. 21P]
MNQSFNIDLPEGFVKPESLDDMGKFIERLFCDNSKAYAFLQSALQYENKSKFGPSSISNTTFSIEHFDEHTLKGRMRVNYDMQLTFGCEDFTKDHRNQHSYYEFGIDLQKNTIHFDGDVIEERSTADEF